MSKTSSKTKIVPTAWKKYKNNNTAISNSYHHMMHRCYDKKDIGYKNYGGRGVVVCEEWRNSYQSFLDWALSNGWQKGLQIDKDIKGNGLLYSPETCCWVTGAVNSRYRRTSVKFLVKGALVNLIDISAEIGIERRTISKRVKLGWTKDQSISQKLRGSDLKNFGAFKEGKLIHTFYSIDDAVKVLGGDRKKIWRILTGRTKKSNSIFEFKFLSK